MSENWKQWQGRNVADGIPLKEYLGGSETTAVYLTSYGSQEKAAVKLLAAGSDRDSRLAALQVAEKLSHPNLLKIFASGRGEIDGEAFLYSVTEFAEENVAQVLPSRALTAEEVGEMLPPILDALDYVHSQGMVLANLKPANIMASSDQLKLASDGVKPIGPPVSPAGRSPYPAPDHSLTAASDIWSLGMSLVEVLTRKLPNWDPSGSADAVPPSGLPTPFDAIAMHSLLRDPNLRWNTADIRKSMAPAQAPPPAKPVAPPASMPVQPVAKPAAQTPKVLSRRPLTIGVLVAMAVLATIAIPRMRRSPTANIEVEETAQTSTQPQAQEPPTASAESVDKPSAAKATVHPGQSQESEASSFEPPPPSRSAIKTSGTSNSAKKISDWDDAQPSAIANPVERESETTSNHEGVVHEVLPDVPAKARNTIQGKVRVKVKVAVDRSGNVTAAEFVSPGPSKYFSRLAMGAARDWKFAPAQTESRAWNLQFDFRRGGTTATPTAISR